MRNLVIHDKLLMGEERRSGPQVKLSIRSEASHWIKVYRQSRSCSAAVAI